MPTCNDRIMNGAETDVDCGGALGCSPCGNGKNCLLASDCTSGICINDTCRK